MNMVLMYRKTSSLEMHPSTQGCVPLRFRVYMSPCPRTYFGTQVTIWMILGVTYLRHDDVGLHTMTAARSELLAYHAQWHPRHTANRS